MYKDKDKQREADRARQKRRRDVIKSKGVTNTGRDGQGVTGSCTVDYQPTYTGNPKRGKDIAEPEVMVEIDNDGNITPITVIPKRGKDIKCFADLPPDVQQTINEMSVVDGKVNQTIKANRTAIAITYHRAHPDRYEPTGPVCTGVVTGKPGDADYNGICTAGWRAERGR